MLHVDHTLMCSASKCIGKLAVRVHQQLRRVVIRRGHAMGCDAFLSGNVAADDARSRGPSNPLAPRRQNGREHRATGPTGQGDGWARASPELAESGYSQDFSGLGRASISRCKSYSIAMPTIRSSRLLKSAPLLAAICSCQTLAFLHSHITESLAFSPSEFKVGEARGSTRRQLAARRALTQRCVGDRRQTRV